MADELTPREVADELGVTPRTVQRWIADGRLPASRVGARVRVSRSSLSLVSAPPPRSRAIETLLVANRGEIAARIARTARRLGIRVVGVHAPDEGAPEEADVAYELESFLDAEALLTIARRAGADAVHPGYGFLAENPAFARAVIASGLTWVGPPADAIAAMGDKAAARRTADALGVPIVPGYDGDDQYDAALISQAQRIGYPLLLKPSAGGGGKGMRVVRSRDDIGEALATARREADRSFGDERLVLERYLVGSRHVEIQVMYDAHGNGVHLGERDCSAQRRNQKIVEEAPAPSTTPELRARMGAAALRVAGAVGYVSAGTVEMLLTDAGDFFFLEMNTRLQVEHPVTEEVIGRDLVEDQLRIAAGATLHELGIAQPPPIRGHAIEARIYAEDPESGFLPATGTLATVTWPDGVRVDAGVRQGDRVSDRFDPMLAKLVASGMSRLEAIDRLRTALAETTILGVRTNVRFLRWLMDQPVMRDGEMRTDTIATLSMPGPPRPGDGEWQSAAVAASKTSSSPSPWSGGWRLNAASVLLLRHGTEERSVSLPLGAGRGGQAISATPAAARDGDVIHVDVEGQSVEFRLAAAPSVDEARRHASGAAEGASVLAAPMPGRVIAVRASEGEEVRAHQPLVVIEAMKMEHAVVAAGDGRVVRVTVSVGQQVQRGDVVAEVAESGVDHDYHATDG